MSSYVNGASTYHVGESPHKLVDPVPNVAYTLGTETGKVGDSSTQVTRFLEQGSGS